MKKQECNVTRDMQGVENLKQHLREDKTRVHTPNTKNTQAERQKQQEFTATVKNSDRGQENVFDDRFKANEPF